MSHLPRSGANYRKILHDEVRASRVVSLLDDDHRRVFSYIVQGYSVAAIASEMQVSEGAINNIREALVHKTGCKTTADLVREGLLAGLQPK